jgi:hypothetical protein
MAREMSSDQFNEWLADYSLSPWRDEGVERMIAVLVAMVGSIFRKQGDPPLTLEDVLPNFDRDADKEDRLATPEETVAWARRWCLRVGGRIEDNPDGW